MAAQRRNFDVFNGDADGLCALHQLRLAEPAPAILVTGVKRDIQLLERVDAGAGDTVTVLDISLDSNRPALDRLLAAGASIRYFDHHFAGTPPSQPNFTSHIDLAADTCTSLLVDRHLKGRFHLWAVVAAYGDGLGDVACRLAAQAGLSDQEAERLRQLGESLNYNAYGETVADLRFAPDALYAQMEPYEDPFEFISISRTFQELLDGYRSDMAAAADLRPQQATDHGVVYVLPDAGWSRRVSGVFANDLADRYRDRAHAVLTQKGDGGYLVSVRAPKARPAGADALCLKFATGGGRKAAAGINHLPDAELDRFVREFGNAFADA